MAKRRKHKKWKPKRQRPRLIFFLGFLVVSVVGLFYLASLPIWKINDVIVHGAKMLSADQIRSTAGIPLAENLFMADFSRAKKNLSKITAIEKIKLYRIPPGTVIISIYEREPIAMIVFPKKSVIIGRQGHVINRNPGISLNIDNLADLPVVSGISDRALLVGDRVNQKVTFVVAEIISQLRDYLEPKKMQLELGGLREVSFLLDDLLYVKVGAAENVQRKMEVFQALLPSLAGRWSSVQYVDVRYPENPVVAYKD